MNIYNITNQLHPTETLTPLNLKEVFYILIHHTDSSGNYTWQQCNLDHKANRWACCGYNEIIYKNGDVYICRGDNIGAQCSGMNSQSYGISLIGNYDKEATIPESQFAALIERIKYHKARLPNKIKIAPHKQFYKTSCPGKFFPFDELLLRIGGDKMNAQEALNILQEKGVISNTDYWRKAIDVTKYLDQLIINMASKLK